MFFISLIILLCGLFSFSKFKPQYYIYFFFIGVILAVYSGFRSTDADHDMYIYLYHHLNDVVDVEPSFNIIVNFSKMICENEPIIMFIIYAFIGVFLKLRAIAILSNFIFLSLAIYVSEYYILQEMTQIRAGIAGGLFLLSIKPLYNKKWINFAGCCILATIFHYSAILMLILPFLNATKIDKRIWIVIILLAYVMLPLMRYILSLLLNISFGSEKIDAYIYALSNANKTSINIFSPIQIIRIAIALFLTFNCRKCIRYNQYSYLLIKIYIIGIISLVLFSSVDVIAFRISEMFLLSEIILIPLICVIFKPEKTGKFVSLAYSGILLVMMVSQKIIS